jgi:hypothetical protein
MIRPAAAALLSGTLLSATLLLGTLLYGCAGPDSGAARALSAAREFQATLPSYLRPVAHSPVPRGLASLRASECGVCHVEIYREWRESSHARAWRDDPQFLEEMKKTTATAGRDASWICMNCHTPFEAQLPRLLAGLEGGDRGRPTFIDNPHFDARLQDEGVTCATCHVRDGVILGSTGSVLAPHPVRKSDALRSADLCLACHQVEATLEDVELVCTFDTGETFAAGPYPAEGKVCQSCHMPEIMRPMTNLGTPVRAARRHWFGGSLIPKKPEFEAGLAPVRAHYPNGARVAWEALPAVLPAGRRTTLTFTVTNAEAGHTLPTGDVERYLTVTARVRAADGTILAERAERFGTRYEWHPKARRLDDTRLRPRETRSFPVEFAVPAGGEVTLELVGENHRMSPENVAYHGLEGKTVPSRVFLEARETRPVR